MGGGAEDLADESVPAGAPPPTESKPFETLKDFFGLFAGIAAAVYILGGAVLSMRLSFENLPGEAAFGQLPRDFLLTIGMAQVLLPAVIVAGLHAAYRVLVRPRSMSGLAGTVAGSVLWLALLGVALAIRGNRNGRLSLDGNTAFWVGACVALVIAVAIAAAVRWRYSKGDLRWRGGPDWLTLTFVYGAAAMIAATFVAATFPLLEARACMERFAENGDLVGQSNDRIFLGENTPYDRRIASLPAGSVQELFIGPRAGEAECDFEDSSGESGDESPAQGAK